MRYCRECERYGPHDKYCPRRRTGWRDGFFRRTPELAPDIDDFGPAELVAIWGDRCYYCGGDWSELDHAVPVAAGGHHTLANCRPTCAGCNFSKAASDNRLIRAYRAAHGVA